MNPIFKNLFACAIALIFTTTSKAQNTYSAEILAGYNRGLGLQAQVIAHKPIESLPIGIRIGIGFNKLEPGSSTDARRVFINNATNGVPEKKAKSFDYRLDFLFPMTFLGHSNSAFIVGPRYSSFRANFKYVGGNEDFDVTSRQLGFGLGIESTYPMSSTMNLLAGIGFDYFLDNTLIGHDTQYSPGDDNVNARNDNENENSRFTYRDADKSIKQPQIMPRLLIGVRFAL